MVACLVRDQTFHDRLGMHPRLPARHTSGYLHEPQIFDDEIAIDFPAVSRIVARICDSLCEEDQHPRLPTWGPRAIG